MPQVDAPDFALPDPAPQPDLSPLRRANGSIRLRPAVDADAPYLWKLFTTDEISYRWAFRGRATNVEVIRAALHRPEIMPHVIERTADLAPLGYVVAYDVSNLNGHAHIGCVVDAEHIGSGVGVWATVLLVDYLFAALPLHKVYLKSIEYSFVHYRSLVRRGYAQIEGVLRRDEYFGDRHWDTYIVAIERETFMKNRHRIRLGER